MLPVFKPYYKATAIETVWYWHKNGNIGQWNRTKSPKVNSPMYGQLIYNKGDKNIQWRMDNLLNKLCW